MSLWTPAEITTALWLDADDSSTITTVSGAVSEWRDKSGNARHVGQGTAGARPGYASAAQNGRDALTFDGGEFLLTTADFPLTGNPDFSVFVAYRKTTNTGGCLFGWGNQAVARACYGFYDDGSAAGHSYSGGQGYLTSATPVDTSTILGSTKRAGAINTTSSAWRDGSDNATSGHSTQTPAIQARPFYLGQWATFTSNRLIGSVFEVVVLPAEATTETRQLIEGYLAWKWGLQGSLPADHPYKSAAPTLSTAIWTTLGTANDLAPKTNFYIA